MPSIRIIVLLSLVLLLSTIVTVEAKRPISSVHSSDGDLDEEELDLEDVDDGEWNEPPPE